MKDTSQLQHKAGRPFERDWASLSAPRRHDAAVELIGLALDAIAEEHREPDDVESINLSSAISAARHGLHDAAFGFVQQAIEPTPAERRRGLIGLHRDAHSSVKQLRSQVRALNSARGQGLSTLWEDSPAHSVSGR